MGIDYGEILCTAVDEIITARMQGLAYDITKLCTIVDDTNSYQGKYVVSDGTARYEAYSTDNNLKKGNSVLVTIPNSDYSMQKIIKGRVAATDTTPFRYTSPLDTMISIKSEFTDTVIGENEGLTANNPNEQISNVIYSIGSTQALTGISGFTRLGVSANFKSLLSNFDVVSGSYGIKLVVYSEIIDKPGSKKDAVYVLDFNSADMIGNPYQFEDFFSQEKVFDISYINRVKRVDAYFYQGNNFIDGNGEKIPFYVSTGEGFKEIVSLPHNLFVDSIKVYLGYDKNEFKDETLMIYTDDSLSYHYSLEGQENKPSENRKTIQLRWIHKVSENEFTLITGNDIDNKKYEVNWFKYSPGWEDVDKYAGKNWEKITASAGRSMECQFDPDITKQKEEIKAIGIIRDGDQAEIEGTREDLEKAYVSNLLTFENEEEVPDNKTWEAASALQIRCEDDSEGNYYIYNQNGKINNQGIGQGYVRYLKAYYKGAEITSNLGSLDYIKWYIPAEKSMMIYTDALGKENNGKTESEKVLYKQVNYKLITRKPNEETGLMNTTQGYSIANQWTYQNSNNTVRCQVSIDGVIYEAAEELRFGKSGTNGTNVSLVLELDDNANALVANKDEKITVSLWMYNEEGVRSGFTQSTQKEDIQWDWFKKSDTEYMSFEQNENNYAQVIITSKTDKVPEDNYFILQATYNNLTAYLPIPLKSANTSFIEGAREVIYDHQGIPSYYNDVYNLYYLGEDGKYVKVPSLSTTGAKSDWILTCDGKGAEKNTTNSYFPTLKDTKYGVALSAAAFYAKGYSDKVCIKGSYSNYAWSQPILIMQSRYDFAMLNDWDGSLTLDENNGTILSTMLGAGRKNSDNSFSGVLIGDIQQGTGLESANSLTGVYGLQDGKISYSLTEDGKAILGANGNGQIIIDGSKSLIKTKGYDITGSSGMVIDLNTGYLDIRNNSHKSLVHLSAGLNKSATNDDPYFLVQTQEGKQLIKIADTEYFLQSNNYSAARGSKYDLMSGEFYVAGDGGSFKVSPKKDNSLLEINCSFLKNGEDKTATLLKVGSEDYYLQSKDYENAIAIVAYEDKNSQKIAGKVYEISELYVSTQEDENGNVIEYTQEQKTKDNQNAVLQISNIVITTETTTTNNKTVTVKKIFKAEHDADNNKWYKGKEIIFNKVVSNYKTPEGINQEVDVLTAEENKQKFLSAAIQKYTDTTLQYKGFKLDLNSNLIEGYNLRLIGIKEGSGGKQRIVIDSSDEEAPLRIGENFTVDWDGIIHCKNPDIGIKNGGGNINLGSFYINSGSAGGGTWRGPSTSVDGFGGSSITSSDGIEITALGHA